MLAEQAAENAAKVEEAYGGIAQRASNSSLSSHHFSFLLPDEAASSHGSYR